ncbi:hypothetical protein FFR91_05480 [Mycoplasma mycoides subsp. mycoides]|nr:hypothetical protein [Mycoplasma mycoides]ADK69070.1 conserved domain protein [Mycoplasma mycoides subsp. mycoides SC str. Gladysdale]CAE77588.1 Hypothetical transmembrane protein [Mycoplasma mycoides subsp. mycoides SC str. PG1]ADK69419.1 conserved domain protein [Mycoplasma mycoides subsp. mycoides SC str. Gladysdale]AIZ55844.1 hypothetical protein mycmycITA_01032 [Mycoplasma mycoides subsp. mycoides]AIZ55852.1 hypothetical protein mycmycITA_01040 [Mycoplasma mycoides subsp. mycoides]
MINQHLNIAVSVFFYITLVIGIIFMLLLSSDWLFFMFAYTKNKKKLAKHKPKKIDHLQLLFQHTMSQWLLAN